MARTCSEAANPHRIAQIIIIITLCAAAGFNSAARAPLNILHGTREMQRTRGLNCQDACNRAADDVSLNYISKEESWRELFFMSPDVYSQL